MKIKQITSNIRMKTAKAFSFLSGSNARYIDQMYSLWKKDPSSVHNSWKAYFENMENGLGENSFVSPPTLERKQVNYQLQNMGDALVSDDESLMIIQLIRAYQKNGYLKANLDPLRLIESQKHYKILDNLKDLHFSKFGFTESDLEKEYTIPFNKLKLGIAEEYAGKKIKLKELIERLEAAYCGKIGVEFKHITNREEVNYIINVMEREWYHYKISKDDKLEIYKKLVMATKFESFCDKKFTTKRFGVEGLETLITGLQQFIEGLSNNGVKSVTMGMAHRGRLNVLANILGKPKNIIFKEFMEKVVDREGWTYWRSGDVKYHLGYSSTKLMKNQKVMDLEILPNPSHLEAVDPVVKGKVRANQHYKNDYNRKE